MAQFTTSNLNPTQLVGRELSIASSFVKQYYTLLNKAPCYIYNFYSHDSTFIHGTIEVANEQYTEPIVGREKIKKKMEDLKLNDCRAKIKQIDCLETLAGGLVIQVIGELSNNGRPMRRFLQTFVLAPSPDESRAAQADGDTQHNSKPPIHPDTRSRNTSAPNQQQHDTSPSQNQKFFVLNSIFRYQDDVIDHEDMEDDVNVTLQTHTAPSAEMTGLTRQETIKSTYQPNVSTNVMQLGHNSNMASKNPIPTVTSYVGAGTGNIVVAGSATNSISDYPQTRRKQVETKTVDEVERLGGEVEEKVKLTNNKPLIDSGNEYNKDFKSSTSNGTAPPAPGGNLDKKSETTCEKTSTTENAKQIVAEHLQGGGNLSAASSVANQQSPSGLSASITPTSKINEPKTWANMVRNAHALPASTQTSSSPSTNATKGTSADQQIQQQSLPQSQQQASPNQATNQQPQNQQSAQNNTNRRRHMMRKPSNKATGPGGSRPMNKNRPPRPPIHQPQGSQHQQQSPSNQATGNNKPFA